jgi:ABC-type dipeptide/oligopeptide/nickel transport system permease subunit
MLTEAIDLRRLRIARARLARRPVAIAALCVVLAFISVALLAPVLAPYSPTATDFNATFAHSSARHLLGTDELGRDTLSRLIWGARVSLLVGFLAVVLAVIVGVPVGIAAAYLGGWVDTAIARATDVFLAFPYVILAVCLATILGPSQYSAMLALALAALPHFIRVARGETFGIREEAYVKAAIVSGAGAATVIFRHVLPNMRNVVLLQATMAVPGAIIGEAALSLLGLGVRPPAASWGLMLSDGQNYLNLAPRLMLYPGLVIAVVALAFNLLGDGLRDVLDPKTVR